MADTPNPGETPRRGRPPKINDALILSVAEAIAQGSFRLRACALHGISPTTYKRWMRDGLNFPDGIYGVFRAMVLEAEAEFEAKAVKAISTFGKEIDPKFLCWLLERKYPQRWGRFRGELGILKQRIVELEKLVGADATPDTTTV